MNSNLKSPFLSKGQMGRFILLYGKRSNISSELPLVSTIKEEEDRALISGSRYPSLTTTAFLFEAVLGVPAALLLRIQLRYDMQMAKSKKKLIDWILSEKTDVL